MANGSAFNDFLTGTAGDNYLRGLGGNDTIEGGAGTDIIDGGSGYNRASYAGAASGVTVSLLQTGFYQQTGGGGRDKLLNIRALLGSDFNDTLTGDDKNNELRGAAGDDTLAGGGGNDVIDGGSGYDTADYSGADTGIHVDLTNDAAQNTRVGLDTLISIESLVGSRYDDWLTGTSGDNVIDGGRGRSDRWRGRI